jgi:CDP-paratose 2-epimerase
MGHQVRDCLHPVDLANLISQQIKFSEDPSPYTNAANDQPQTTLNVSGGIQSAFSLLELHQWCERRWGANKYGPRAKLTTILENRRYDAPWIVLDSSLAQRQWGWTAQRSKEEIWEEIAEHAEEHPDWLQISQALS